MNVLFTRRSLAVLTGGLLIGAIAPAVGADRSPAGIDQWISIKGERRGNPVLLVVHGGPGEAQWPEAEI